MFVGHLAVAFGAKTAAPHVPLGTLIGAAFALDLIWPWLLLTGVERVDVQPGMTAFTPLEFAWYPWSHSLLTAAIWGLLLAVALRFRRGAWIAAGAVVSHWVLDVITHVPDLPLWPGGPLVGLGLWNSIAGTLVIEGALFAAAVAAYLKASSARTRAGRWSLWALVLFCTVIWVSGPLSPPPPNATAVAVVALAMWIFPLWGRWIERNRVLDR